MPEEMKDSTVAHEFIRTVISTGVYGSSSKTRNIVPDSNLASILLEYSSPTDPDNALGEHIDTLISTIECLSRKKRPGADPSRVISAIHRVLSDPELVDRFGFGGDLHMSKKDPGYPRYAAAELEPKVELPESYLKEISGRWPGPCCPKCDLPSFNVPSGGLLMCAVRCPCEAVS